MKRILILACLAGLLAGPAWALDVTPLQIGIAGTKAQLFPATTKVMGLRLNLACSDNQDVLGVDELHMYDLYVPMVAAADRRHRSE